MTSTLPPLLTPLYDSIGHAGSWNEALSAYAHNALHAQVIALSLAAGMGNVVKDLIQQGQNHLSQRPVTHIVMNIPAQIAAGYARYASTDAFVGRVLDHAAREPRGVVVDAHVNLEVDAERYPAYRDLLKPNGIARMLSAWGGHSSVAGRNFYLTLTRQDFHRPFTGDDQQLIWQDLPHLERVTSLHGHILQLEQRAARMEALVDEWSTGVLLLATDGRLRYANARAQQLLHEGSAQALGSFVKGGIRKSHAHEGIQAAFRDALAGHTRCLEWDAQASGLGSQEPLLLVALPGRHPQELRSGTEPHEGAIFVLLERHQDNRRAVELARKAWGLSPTEATLLAALTQGMTPADFAAAKGSKISTVRTHLSHLLRKTRTSRQQDLNALVARLMDW